MTSLLTPTPESVSVRSPRRALHILLVEDHEDCAEMMQLMLSLKGWTVSIAGSVAQAREQMRQGNFDVMVSDVGLPDGCGITLMADMRKVRAERGLPPLKAIALSGYGMAADITRSREAGFAAHLVKPIEGGVLESAIEQLLMAQ